jgi:hypothetical protein
MASGKVMDGAGSIHSVSSPNYNALHGADFVLSCPMNMKSLLLLGLASLIAIPAFCDDKTEATKVVDSFYASYIAAISREKPGDADKVVKKSPQLSPAFKEAYAALMAKARKDDPELGLGYDPIVCGQDFPDAGYAVTSITLKDAVGSAVVSSKDKSFKQTIPVSLVKSEGKWLINGVQKLKGK